jgi:hypothetical protein
VPNLIPPGSAGYYAFGSFLSPRYQFASASGHQDNPYGVGDGLTDGEIPPVPTTQTPAPFGADRIGVIVVTPDPTQFPPPWPAAIYGPGFTRSDYDIFVTADYNASLGIVTLATNPAGHGFGPLSTTTVTAAGVATTFLSYGRGRDLDGDGLIGDGLNDGVGPTGHVQPDSSVLPSRKPIDGLASGLIQTVVDNMALGARSGRPRHPRDRTQPRRPVEDHVLRAQLRRHLRDDADGAPTRSSTRVCSTYPVAPSSTSHGSRLPRRPGRQARRSPGRAS